MGLDASKEVSNQKGKSEPLEAGNYVGRLVQVLDLGIQAQRPYQGQEKAPAHEIMLTYELGTEFVKDEDGNDIVDKPRFISESIPLRNLGADLAKSTKRAAVFDPRGVAKGNFVQMVNAPCTITIVQNPKKGTDIIYNNIANVTPPMKGFVAPPLVNEPKVFDLDAPDMEVFLSLPEWVQDKIKSNLNFHGSALQRLLNGEAPEQKKEEPKAEAAGDSSNPWD